MFKNNKWVLFKRVTKHPWNESEALMLLNESDEILSINAREHKFSLPINFIRVRNNIYPEKQ